MQKHWTPNEKDETENEMSEWQPIHTLIEKHQYVVISDLFGYDLAIASLDGSGQLRDFRNGNIITKEYDLWMSIPDAPYSDNEDQPAEALDAERKKRDGGE